MGQLEKYGLYVLCLVIFLILGVALWGDPAPIQGAGKGGTPVLSMNGDKAVPEQPPAKGVLKGDDPFLDKLFSYEKEPGKGGKSGKTEPGKPDDAPKNAPEPGNGAGDKPAVEPAVLDSRRPVYRIKAGDTLGGISASQLGTATLVDEIKKLNQGVDERHLRPGSDLVLPSKADLARLRPRQAAANEPVVKPSRDAAVTGTSDYVLVKGDSFAAIAKKLFKSEARANEIMKLNPGLDPKRLIPGKHILVPAR